MTNEGGCVLVGSDSIITIVTGSTFTQDDGITDIDGTLISDGDLNLFDGVFYGSGDVQANVNNIGATVSPDSTSAIGDSAGDLLFAKKFTHSVCSATSCRISATRGTF